MLNMRLTKNKVFIYFFFIFTSISLLQLFLNTDNFKFYFHQDNADSFMDLYNSIMFEKGADGGAPEDSYYPPLSIIPYRIMGYGVNTIDNSLPLRQRSFILRHSMYGAFLLLLYLIPFLLSFFVLIFYIINGTDKRKLFYSILLSCSGLMFWTLERGNIIIYAFIFTMLFVCLYHSDNKKSQLLAYICLAVAANLKLYPAVFGLLLIEKRDWTGIVRCISAFAVIYLLSFLFCRIKLPMPNVSSSIHTDLNVYASFFSITPLMDGLKTLLSNVANGFIWGESTAIHGSGLNFSIINFCKMVYLFFLKITHFQNRFDVFELYYVNHIGIYRMITSLVFLMGIFSFFFANEKWKKLAIPAFLCFYIPPTSWMYVLIFMFIPFVEFLNSAQKSSFDKVYSIFFAIIFSLIIIPCKVYAEVYFITGAFALQSVVLLVMYICIFISSFRNLVNTLNFKN